jgi:serine/threonine protein phosphatase PrpC
MPRSKLQTLEIDFAQLSDVGTIREGNEDYIGHCLPETPVEARSRGWLFALADGVGGRDHGEIASRTAVESVLAGFRSASPGEVLSGLLPRLVQQANSDVHDAGLSLRPAGNAMATTLVLCSLRYDRVVVAHVGDSRCYLIRRGRAQALTSDHTVANEQRRLGLRSDQAATSHILSRAVGTELFVNVDCSEHTTLPGDILLLCSDGLHGALPDGEIASLVTRTPDLKAAAHQLVAIANERDGSDNVSVQLIRVRGVERVGMYRGRPYLLR